VAYPWARGPRRSSWPNRSICSSDSRLRRPRGPWQRRDSMPPSRHRRFQRFADDTLTPSRPATSVGPRPSSNSAPARRRCFSNSDWLDGLRASACPMNITTSQTTVFPFCTPSHLRRTH
jgi:hypothetical protein